MKWTKIIALEKKIVFGILLAEIALLSLSAYASTYLGWNWFARLMISAIIGFTAGMIVSKKTDQADATIKMLIATSIIQFATGIILLSMKFWLTGLMQAIPGTIAMVVSFVVGTDPHEKKWRLISLSISATTPILLKLLLAHTYLTILTLVFIFALHGITFLEIWRKRKEPSERISMCWYLFWAFMSIISSTTALSERYGSGMLDLTTLALGTVIMAITVQITRSLPQQKR